MTLIDVFAYRFGKLLDRFPIRALLNSNFQIFCVFLFISVSAVDDRKQRCGGFEIRAYLQRIERIFDCALIFALSVIKLGKIIDRKMIARVDLDRFLIAVLGINEITPLSVKYTEVA